MGHPFGARRRERGFSLIELLVATALAGILLLGLNNLITSMVASKVSDARASTVGAWSAAGIDAMNTAIAGAGAIGYPPSGAAGGDSLIVCTNWSMKTAPPAKVVAGLPTDAFYYCWDTTDAAPYGNALLRKIVSNVAVCPTAAIACTQAAYAGGATGADTVVTSGVYKNGLNPIFVQDPSTMNAVRLRYSVGNPAAGAVSAGGNGATVTASPITVPYDTEIILED